MIKSDLDNSLEKCRAELLNYKLDEILSFYEDDFGEDVAKEIEKNTLFEIVEGDPNYHTLLKNKIIYLWYELVGSIIDVLEEGLEEVPPTIDFSDINIELSEIKKRVLKNRKQIETLQEIYFNDISKIKIKVKSRIDVNREIHDLKNKQTKTDYSLLYWVFFCYILV